MNRMNRMTLKMNKINRTTLKYSVSNINRNLTVSPCGRSAGTVPDPPELDTKNKIMLRNDHLTLQFS